MIIKHLLFANLWQNTIIFLGIFPNFISSLNSKTMGVKMTMDFYGIKMCLCMECTQMKKLNGLCTHIFLELYHYYQIHYKMHNNINTCVHVNRFHYPFPPMREIQFSEPFQINWNYPFSQQYLHTQANLFFNLWKLKKEIKIYHFQNF
jgi:hypothetical protein